MQHFNTRYNERLADQTRNAYIQAGGEGFARTHFLTPSERFDRYVTRYAQAKREGRLQAAAAIKRMANRIVEQLH